jgi:hypothetical protein
VGTSSTARETPRDSTPSRPAKGERGTAAGPLGCGRRASRSCSCAFSA